MQFYSVCSQRGSINSLAGAVGGGCRGGVHVVGGEGCDGRVGSYCHCGVSGVGGVGYGDHLVRVDGQDRGALCSEDCDIEGNDGCGCVGCGD